MAPPRPAPPRHRPRASDADAPGPDESAWLEVIQKMDEVYSQLVADETALEEKNAQLEQSQRFIFSLLSSMSDVLVACRDGLVEETNAALCALVGRGDDKLRGTPVADLLVDPEEGARLRRLLQSVLPQRGSATVELRLRDAEGQPVPVDFNCSVRRDAQGKPIGHVLVGRPLGEIQRAYHALREAHEALKRTQAQLVHSEKMASLGRLVAGVAHELNNPISFVLGNVKALGRYGERLQQYVDALHGGADAATMAALRAQLRIDALLADLPSLIEGMHEGASRTADIVAGLRRFSAVDREAWQPVALAAVVEQAVHWVRRGTAPGLEVDLEPGPPCSVEGHPGQLLQVAMNLIQNAADATAGVDRPTLRVRLDVDEAARRVRVRFDDNGPGIADDDLPHIFEPFFTTKKVGMGTGLGLSISYGIVEQHGGSLRAGRSDATGGACFVLELPLHGEAPAGSDGSTGPAGRR